MFTTQNIYGSTISNKESSIPDSSMLQYGENNGINTIETGEKDMSIVGIIKVKSGVVAFGDSKSSYIYDETRHPSQLKPNVQKVFKKDDLVLVTWGDNEVRLDNGKTTPLSEVIEGALTKDSNSADFCEHFQDELLHIQADKTQSFNFYIAYKDPEGDYCITRQAVSKYEIQRSFFTYQCGMYWAGHDKFMATGMPIDAEWSIAKTESVATAFVESAIKLAEICEGEMAPIGGEVQIAVLS